MENSVDGIFCGNMACVNLHEELNQTSDHGVANAGAPRRLLKGSPNYIWETKKLLGTGAIGTVYIGRHRKSGVKVAIKDAHIGSNSDFEQEWNTFLTVSTCENIVKLIAVEKETMHHRPILVMELCNRGSLSSILQKPIHYYGLPEEELVAVLRCTSEGLRHLWMHSIVHRDIKPGNILLSITPDGRRCYKIADLGAATVVDGQQTFRSLFGTEEYLHPDAHAAMLSLPTTRSFDYSVDTWAFGVTLYQCATGRLPFKPAKGVRKDRKTMHLLIKDKQPGVISQVERTEGKIESSRELPSTCTLSRATRGQVVDMLRMALDNGSNPAPLFSAVETFVALPTLHVFDGMTLERLVIRVAPEGSLSDVKDAIKEQTNIRASDQLLFHCHHPLEFLVTPETRVADFSATSHQDPILLAYSARYLEKEINASASLPATMQTTSGTSRDARAACGLVHHVGRAARADFQAQQLLMTLITCLSMAVTTTRVESQDCHVGDRQFKEIKHRLEELERQRAQLGRGVVQCVPYQWRNTGKEHASIKQRYEILSEQAEKTKPRKADLQTPTSFTKESDCVKVFEGFVKQSEESWQAILTNHESSDHNTKEMMKFHKETLQGLRAKAVAHFDSCRAKFVVFQDKAIRLIRDLVELLEGFHTLQRDLNNHLKNVNSLSRELAGQKLAEMWELVAAMPSKGRQPQASPEPGCLRRGRLPSITEDDPDLAREDEKATTT